MNSQLQESSSLIKCDYCHDINKYTYNFSCNHNICCICLYRRIFSYNLKEIQNENEIITINCKCEKGKLGKNFDEIVQIIHKKSLLDKEYQNFKKKNNNNIQYPKCDIHSLNIKSLYCVDCFENICSECLKNEIKNFHIDHRIIAAQKLENLIKKNIKDLSLTIPNKNSFMSKFDSIGKKLKETTEKEFNETIKLIDNFANSLFQFRKEYEEIYRNELTRCVKSLKLIKLFYLNYFYDKEVSLDSKNINLLRFVNNISFEFIDLNLIHNKIINSKISEMQTSIDSYFKENNKEKNIPNLRVELIFNEVPRNFKCENIISKAHNKQIRALLETQDQKLISSGYDFKMKFWEEKENGFESNSEIKNLCGAVTCVIQIKDGRILSSSASDNNIKVWKENSNGIYELNNSLSSHNKPISCLVELNDLRIASASIDTSVIIWLGQNNEFIVQQKISDEKRPILNIISLSDCRIAFTTDEGIIKIWGENNNNNNIVFNKFSNFHYNFNTFNNNSNIKEVNNINFSNNSEFKFKSFLKKHIGRVNCMCELKNHYLISGGANKGQRQDHHIIIWKPTNDNFSYSQTLRGHQSDINSIIELIDGRIASSSKDRTIRIWKFTTNLNGNSYFVENEVLSDYSHGLYCLIQLRDGRLCANSSDNAIIFWRNRSGNY